MRTSIFRFGGQNYVVCMSTRVLMQMQDEGLTFDGMGTQSAQMLRTTFRLLELMIAAGDKYAKKEGIDNPGTLTFDELVDSTGPEDYEAMLAAVTQAAAGERRVEAEPEPGKNATATRGTTGTTETPET